MDTIKVSKAELLTKLKENRAAHQTTYVDALDGCDCENDFDTLERIVKDIVNNALLDGNY